MAKGCCGSAGGCSCILRGAEGIRVKGSGTFTDPYQISTTFDTLAQFFQVEDTATVNLSLIGSGTGEDPLLLRATSTLALGDLVDVDDTEGAEAGDTIVYVGSGESGHFEFRAPAVTPAGSVNVGPGLLGQGSLSNPIRANVSGVWGEGDLAGYGSDSTIGNDVYLDSQNRLRTTPGSGIVWESIAKKPLKFPPAPHSHSVADLTDVENLSVVRINGVKITSTPTGNTPPANPANGDLWFFPKVS